MTDPAQTLAPCPFCGATDIRFDHENRAPRVYCSNCRSTSPDPRIWNGQMAYAMLGGYQPRLTALHAKPAGEVVDKNTRLKAWVNYEPGIFDDSQINMGAHLRHAYMTGWEDCTHTRPSPTTDAVAVRAALVSADNALRNHACHGGDATPCLRARYQCDIECGREAGDALLLVEAALAQLPADQGEGK